MGKQSEFVSDLISSARKVSNGSSSGRYARDNGLRRFGEWLWTNNFQVPEVTSIKTKHIEAYAQYLKDDGLDLRTIANNLSFIRSALRGRGKSDLAIKVSNDDLGIAGAQRTGRKRAISDEEFSAACQMALDLNEVGVFWCLKLERAIGLRAEEALQSVKSLDTWLKFLEQSWKLTVVFGTKGHKPRKPVLLNREKQLEIVKGALQFIATNDGKLVGGSLAQALRHYHYVARKIGLVGTISPHSLRYAYTRDLRDFLSEKGYSEREVWSLVSQSLGHGDGRGRWVKSVYLAGQQKTRKTGERD